MATYTLSSDLLSCLQEHEKKYFSDIFYRFVHSDFPHKVALDKKGVITKCYEQSVQGSSWINSEDIYSWINLMTNMDKFVLFDVDFRYLANEDFFLELCSYVNGSHNLVIYSRQMFPHTLEHDNSYIYKDMTITILDKEETFAMFGPSKIYQNCIFAKGDVNNSNNNNQNSLII